MLGQAETNLAFGKHASLAGELALGNLLASELPKLVDPRWCPFEVPLPKQACCLKGMNTKSMDIWLCDFFLLSCYFDPILMPGFAW